MRGVNGDVIGHAFDARAFIDADLHYLRTMSDGMAGMVHANDVRVAEGLRDIQLPADPVPAMSTWQRALNDATRHGLDVEELIDAIQRASKKNGRKP